MRGENPDIESLILQLKGADPELKESAGRRLLSLGERAIRPLIHALDSGRGVDSRVADLLAEADDPVVADYLIDSLSHKNTVVAIGVCEVLGRRKTHSSVPRLIDLLGSGSLPPKYIINTLREIGDPQAASALVQYLSHSDQDTMFTAARALASFGHASIPFLRMAFEHTNPQIRYMAAKASGWINTPELKDDLLQLVQDESLLAIRDATLALARLADPSLRDLFLGLLGHSDGDVRRHATFGIGQLLDPTTLGNLLERLSDEERSVRIAAAEALGTLGDYRALDLLVGCLQDERGTVRQAAARALGMIGDVRALDPLIQAANDKWEGVRYRAAEALGKLADPTSVPTLVDLLGDTHICHYDYERDVVKRVCDFAAGALRHIGTKEAIAAIMRWELGPQ